MTTNHNNIYNILGKLNAIQPAEQPSQKESILKQLNEAAAPKSLTDRLNAQYQESKQLNEYFHFDAETAKDRGPRDTGTDELARREKTLGKGGLGKGKPFGKEYKEKGKFGDQYKIAGPKGVLPEGEVDEDMIKGKDMPDWVRHPEDPASKVPAYRRKEADPGRMKAAAAADEKNKSAGAKVWRSGRPEDMMGEGWDDMMKAVKDQSSKGTGKFDKKKTTTGTEYTRKSETFDSGEEGTASSGEAAPKKRGRPAKAKGPERTTSKAWKHKGGRKVKEHLNLDTVVEETLGEMDSLLLSEKAVSQQQQKYFGMVHALQTGKKVPGASTSLKKTAKSIGKKDAKDFASTKHKGLPKKVTESIMMDCEDPQLRIVLHRYGKEVSDLADQGTMHPDLYHALHDHYYDVMPASVKRGGGTEDWVKEQFCNEMGIGAAPVALELDLGPAEPMDIDTGVHHDRHEHGDDLDDLAKLAGIVGGSECNHSHEGEYCPEHGLAECGIGMYEGKQVDQDGDGDNDFDDVKIARMKASGMSGKAAKEKVEEAGKQVDQDGDGDNDFDDVKIARMKASGMSGKAAKEKVSEADATLAQMRKIAGLPEVVAEEFANEPDEQYIDQDVINDQGNDLNKKKVQDPETANKAANPIQARLARMYEKLAK